MNENKQPGSYLFIKRIILNCIELHVFDYYYNTLEMIIAAFKYGDCGTPNEASEIQKYCCRRCS